MIVLVFSLIFRLFVQRPSIRYDTRNRFLYKIAHSWARRLTNFKSVQVQLLQGYPGIQWTRFRVTYGNSIRTVSIFLPLRKGLNVLFGLDPRVSNMVTGTPSLVRNMGFPILPA